MATYDDAQVLHRCADGGWSVCESERRLVFLNGGSAMEIPVEGPLRWSCDGVDMSFEAALEKMPPELHGWMTHAALIALRHCVSGIAAGVALPAGYHEWARMAARAEPVCAWMHILAGLDEVEVPPMPDGIDDGLALEDDGEAVGAGGR